MSKKKRPLHVGYGDGEEAMSVKETLLCYGVFGESDEVLVDEAVSLSRDRDSFRVVFYPFHEKTLKRMGLESEMPYHRRVKQVQGWLEEIDSDVHAEVDQWEGKRKKYTPVEASFRFIQEKHGGRIVLALTREMHAILSSYKTFESLMKDTEVVILDKEEGMTIEESE